MQQLTMMKLVHNALRNPFMDVQLEPVNGRGVEKLGNMYAAMHIFYMGEDEEYADAWAAYVRQVMPAHAIARGWTRQDAEQRPPSQAWDFSVGALEDLQGTGVDGFSSIALLIMHSLLLVAGCSIVTCYSTKGWSSMVWYSTRAIGSWQGRTR